MQCASVVAAVDARSSSGDRLELSSGGGGDGGEKEKTGEEEEVTIEKKTATADKVTALLIELPHCAGDVFGKLAERLLHEEAAAAASAVLLYGRTGW